jgi:hypothetical protein
LALPYHSRSCALTLVSLMINTGHVILLLQVQQLCLGSILALLFDID